MTTVLVTGATGRTGRHVVDGLLERGVDVRALVRTPGTAGLPAAVDVRQGDLGSPETVARVASGADAAFLLWPGFSADGAAEVVRALAEHVPYVVHLSAARLQRDEDGVVEGVWADVERLIEGSGVDRTFVRAGGFAANTLAWAAQIRSGDVVEIPHPRAARSLVHERDLADVVVHALTEPALRGRAMAVTGPEVLTQGEQVAVIGGAIGRSLEVREQPPEVARRELAAVLGPDAAASAVAHWATLVDDPERATDVVERLTGRPARSFAEWAEEHRADFVDPPADEGSRSAGPARS